MEPIDSCKHVPNLLSSFVDTFVDFSVTDGLFLPPNSNSQNHQNAPHPKNDENAPGDMRTHYPSPPGRLIAIGDLHGDLAKSKEAFRLANLIDASGNWTGGSTTVVQVGDVLDRGGDEIKILYFLERLRRQAEKTGGKVITMNGNHEIMNVESDFRNVDKSGLKEFRVWAEWYRVGQVMKGLCEGLESPKDVFKGIPFSFRGIDNENGNNEALIQELRARIAALRPNGPISARFLSRNVTVLVIGDSVFVHGGLLPKHVEYGLQRINEEVRDWINGLGGERAPGYCRGPDGVLWLRKFSRGKNCDCETLEHLLATIPGSKRMIMGHTIQKIGINGVCDNQAIRIDVGMSKGCGNGLPEVLEISENSGLRILTSNPLYQDKYKASSHSERKEGFGLLFPEQGPKQVEVKA
ncbi:shewanella-like protein phosphatase 2 [Fagus crenata]